LDQVEAEVTVVEALVELTQVMVVTTVLTVVLLLLIGAEAVAEAAGRTVLRVEMAVLAK
jgi:hypothetical protein